LDFALVFFKEEAESKGTGADAALFLLLFGFVEGEVTGPRKVRVVCFAV
jgi:hypothetical protein